MKKINFTLNAIALGIGIAALPVISWAAFDANSETTPGSEVLSNAEALVASPYAVPSNVVVPLSSKANPADAGVRAHTHYVIRNPGGIQAKFISDLKQPTPAANPTPGLTTAEYPASLSCIYRMGPTYPGCKPVNDPAHNAVGGSGAIAIVIAYDNPTVATDLQNFSSFFGLPAANFQKITMNNSCAVPPFNSGWALESALDTQWAHAMAPGAKIILIEACSNSYVDLMAAEQRAAVELAAYGGGVVSNSWGSGEFSTESTDWDFVFRPANWQHTMFIFSAGDSGLGAEYPSSSPWVVSAGGTTINRNATTFNFTSESCWAGSGGGTSLYETYSSTFGSGTGPWTNYQYPLFGQTNRRTPDISFDADPASGAWVQYAGNWLIVGGTSLSAPALAGIINNSNNRLGQAPAAGGFYSNTENNLLYAQLLTSKEYKTNFYDVKTGSNGAPAVVGWDSCTGVGSPRGKLGK